jgi:hypothetical protein
MKIISNKSFNEGNAMTEISPFVAGLRSIHRIITRGLNVSIEKCDGYLGKKGMASRETVGFSKYATTLKWVIHSHHLTEDEIVFPYFKDRVEAPYTRLGDDHQAMTRILVKLDICLPEVSSGGIAELREVLGELDMLWGPHKSIEEECFTTEKLQPVMRIQEQVNLAKKFADHGSRNSGPAPLAVPFMFYNLDAKNREDFMRMFPWIVKKVLVPVVWREKWKPISPFLLV